MIIFDLAIISLLKNSKCGDILIKYGRYIDDGFVLGYFKDKNDFDEFLNEFNEIDPTGKIKFTCEFGYIDGKIIVYEQRNQMKGNTVVMIRATKMMKRE